MATLTSFFRYPVRDFLRYSQAAHPRTYLTSHNLKHLDSCLTEKNKHLSFAVGVGLLPTIKNLYINGNSSSALVNLINNPKFGLFNLCDTGLRTTQNISLPGTSLNPRLTTSLVRYLEQNRLLDENVKNEITKQWKLAHKEKYGDKSKLPTNRIHDLLAALAQSRIESSNTPDHPAIYPYFYPYALLTAFIWLKANQKSEAVEFLSLLHHQNKESDRDPILKPEWSTSEAIKKLNEEVFKKQELKGTPYSYRWLKRICANPQLFERVIANEAVQSEHFSIIPPQIKQKKIGYKGQPEVPNCAETSLQDLCGQLFSRNKKFDKSMLPSNCYQGLSDFYEKHHDFDFVNSISTAQDWMDMVSGHKGIIYVNNKTSSFQESYELKSEKSNLLKTLNLLFGLHAESFVSLGEQLSSTDRCIVVKEESVPYKNYEIAKITFEIPCDEIVLQTHLYIDSFVDRSGHTWLETPLRDKAEKTISNEDKKWLEKNIASLIHETHKTDSERLIPSILFTQRFSQFPNIIYRAYPWSLEVATHLTYSSNSGSIYPYRSLWANLDKKSLAYIISSEDKKSTSFVILQMLYRAMQFKQFSLVKDIMNKIDNVDLIANTQIELLRQIIEEKHTKGLKGLLKHGFSVNKPNRYGVTLLHVAAHRGEAKFCTLLLQHGANINASTIRGNTPLFLANYNISKLLLAKRARVDLKDHWGKTVLHHTVTWKSSDNLKLCKLLIKYGANVFAKSINGKTPLGLAKLKQNDEMIRFFKQYIDRDERP